jgi:hypothetical protein
MTEPKTPIKSIALRSYLEHDGLYYNPHVADAYTVKEGHELPVTATTVEPWTSLFGHVTYKVEATLPEGSSFVCTDKYCKMIESSADPIITKKYFTGMCLGPGCIKSDWIDKDTNTRKYDLNN